ncbi:ribonuclease P protein component [Leifsonia sp. Leaf336]|uniref:ribonuclease P protein component n=1 Tax=Leifsonia sp. Leaf336 TaxID=1736341 RepID=UPI0009EAABD9|nr:ribonuclease P protein component [Leifsonia sp. Leaf336]
MLAKPHRITRGADYRATVRRGARFTAANTTTHVRLNRDSDVVRFGFIVSKAVGNAVVRNRVRRRLKAAAYEVLPRLESAAGDGPGLDIVIRALPASAQVRWATLHEEVSGAADRFLSRHTTSSRETRRSDTTEGNVRP